MSSDSEATQLDASRDAQSPTDATSNETKPDRSKIKFPYMDLKEASRVPAVIKNNFGSSCDLDQLAGQFKQNVGSGAFRTRNASAAAFGLIEGRRGHITVTALGHEVASGSRKALVSSFLSVELYKTLYDRYRGVNLPADPGLTAEMRSLGVIANQADRARQVMQRSAEFAGFFDSTRSKLIMPPISGGNDLAPESSDEAAPSALPTRSSQSAAQNPLLEGLWSMLPTEGNFPAERRAQWFKALAINLDLVYGDAHLDMNVMQRSSD